MIMEDVTEIKPLTFRFDLFQVETANWQKREALSDQWRQSQWEWRSMIGELNVS